MSEMMKVEADEPGGFILEPPIPAASTSELEETQDSKDLVQMVVIKEEFVHDWSSSSEQQDSEPLDIKEEEEELWISQEEEQLVVKIEDEEKSQLFELDGIKTHDDRETEAPTSSSAELLETEPDGEDCGGPEADWNPDPFCSFQQSDLTVHKRGMEKLLQSGKLGVSNSSP
ncbi:uncharacterized protein FYW61_018018 isoform 2-T2 [Anableps anableps]